MKAKIYSVNNGASMAYQMGNSRALVSKNAEERHEVRENGVWREARGYFKPRFIEHVKSLVRGA